LINKVVEILTVKQFIKTAIIALFVFSIYGIISIFFSDPFVLAGGYSLIWLVILYYIGAGFRHCNIKPKIPMRKYICIVLLIWLANASLFLIIRCVAAAIDNKLISAAAEYLFTAYVSPAVVTLSLAIFFLFAKWNMRPLATNLLLTCSSSAFSVYIIHTHPLLWNRQFRNIARLIGESSGIELLTYIPCLSAAIFLVCLIIDIVRAKLFGLLRISVIFQKIEQGLERVFEKLIYKCSLTIEETSQTNDTDIENSDYKMK
jgi:surface polysaccharide O-acyltransferase-like enzyme